MKCLSNREIRVAFRYLNASLPGRPTTVAGLYSVPKAFDYAFNGSVHQKEAALQKIADHMGHFLGLLNRVKVSFVEKREAGEKSHTVFIADKEGKIGKKTTSEVVEEEKYAGLYRVRGYDHGEISIINDSTFYLIHFLSVLAHEVTHNYLYHHHLSVPKEIDPEELTDLAAVYLGFGSIILRGYSPSTAISCRLGYIDVPTIRRAFLQASSLRKWNLTEITMGFSWFESNRYYFQFHLFPRAVFRALSPSKTKSIPTQASSERVIITCRSCGQNLRLPKKPAALMVTCPKCGSSFTVETNQTKI
jgi:predicted RNA-binding Zn-ribbon protein involved in translation (DUF1610 family)